MCYKIYVILSTVAGLKLGTCIPEDGICMSKHFAVMSVLSYAYTVIQYI
jgi:hypothetical protein